MKRTFVAGILIENGKILLVKRTSNDPDMGGLWSLPAGGVEDGESLEMGIIREFKEETNLDVTVSNQIYTLDRNAWCVVVFELENKGGHMQSNDKDIDDLQFYELDKLPQEIVVEGYLCILRYLEIKNQNNEHYSNIIDKVFTSIFYSYLYPEFSKFDFNAHHQIFKYIVISTPHRKFKSLIPLLLSNSDRKNRNLFLIPELCYAVWTLLDDCYDERMTRYGVDTAIAKFGKKKALISLYQAIHILRELLANKISAKHIDEIAVSLSKSAQILNLRNENDYSIEIDTYLHQSIERTEFLRTSWKISLLETNTSDEIASNLFKVQEQSSIVGQFINDYFDITRGNFEDYDNKTASTHWLLLKREISQTKDTKLLNSLWHDSTDRKDEYKKLIYKYQIKEKLFDIIRQKLIDMIKQINNSGFALDHKNILIAWHQLSYHEFFPEVPDNNTTSTFLNTIDNIFYKI